MSPDDSSRLLGGAAYPTMDRRPDNPVAPFITSAWYVLAERGDVDDELRQRWILGEPVCYYRTTEGAPVALDDRCAHRRFPLSQSHRQGDEIRCGYHGFTYDQTGACTKVPGMARPGPVRIRSYPTAERGPYVWIWTGDPQEADVDLIPFVWHEDVVDPDYVRSGYTYNECNYLLVQENLLDLTHLFFLHGPSAATEEYSTTPPKELDTSEVFPHHAQQSTGYLKSVRSALSGLGALYGADPSTDVVRTSKIISVAPALNVSIQTYTEPDGVTPFGPEAFIVSHCMTPETETTTHQFWSLKIVGDMPFVLDQDVVTAHISEVFSEDQRAVSLQMRMIEQDRSGSYVEHSVRSDRPGLRFRSILADLAAAER